MVNLEETNVPYKTEKRILVEEGGGLFKTYWSLLLQVKVFDSIKEETKL